MSDKILRRALMACLATGLVAQGCTTALLNQAFVITIRNSHFSPSKVAAPAGKVIRFTIRNLDPIDHEFILGNAAAQARHEAGLDQIHQGIPGEVSVEAGATASTTFVFTSAGNWIFACHLPGHYRYGMSGTVLVST